MPLPNITSLCSLFIILIFPFVLLAKEPQQILELKTKLNNRDSTALDAALTKIDIANHYIYHDLDSATVYINHVIQGLTNEAFILPDTFYRHFLIKAWTHQGKGELTKAKLYMNKAIDKAQYNKSRDSQLELIMNYGSLLVQTRDPGILDFVSRELPKVDTTLGQADYVLYSLLHQYESQAYAQQERYEQAIRSLLKISSAQFLKKVPNYKYGIRSSLSKYMSFMGDESTAAIQLEGALKDTLFKHQKRQVYFDLCELKLKVDSLTVAEKYLSSFKGYAGNTNQDKRDYHYLMSKIAHLKGDSIAAYNNINLAQRYQMEIEDNQKLLDIILLKAAFNEKAESVDEIGACVTQLDSLLRADKSLATSINMIQVSRFKLLHKFLESDQSLASDFAAYEASQANLINKKIDPDLIAAVLDFDNKEKSHEINQLTQANAIKDLHLEKQSSRLKWTIGFLTLLSMVSIGLYRINLERKRKNERIIAEKQVLEKKAAEKKLLAEKALAEKKRLAEETIVEKKRLAEEATAEKIRLEHLAAAERKRLEEQQNKLKNRVNLIEQSKLNLEKELAATRNSNKIDSITINTPTKVHKIKTDQLMYVAATNDGTKFYLKDSSFWVVMPLKDVLKQLPESQFIRVFRSTVVNVDFITAVNSKYIVLENGQELAMGRTYKDEVRKRVG